MKKIITSLCVMILLFTSIPIMKANASSSSITLKADGKVVGSIPAPTLSNGVLMFPLVELFEALDYQASVITENGSTQAKINYMNAMYGAEVGSTSFNLYDVTGMEFYRTLTSSQAAILTADQTVSVPLSYIREQIGLAVTWNETYKTLVVNNKGSKHIYANDEDTFHAAYFKVNNTKMILGNYAAYVEMDIDASGGTAPIVNNGTTLVPVSALIKELGGNIGWNSADKKVTLELNGNKIDLWIGQSRAVVNGSSVTLATPAQTINGRTMLPLRFVSENVGLEVYWNQGASTIMLYRPWFKDELEWDAFNYLGWFDNENDLVYQQQVQREAERAAQEAAQKAANNNSSANQSNASTSNKPYDANGNLIHTSDIVTVGFFDGEVRDVNGGKILVYWNSKSYLVPDGDEGFWAGIAGIRYMSSTWIEANKVTISSSGY
ncbi:MAG TPA: copper amine oxidase N-terminal domain-containing protein [Candidatus Paenibacillus intestinavium]|nr:copper amine oxidase N-terminal domain-containing protein [Candidatus Paenibacillus intestinavium]